MSGKAEGLSAESLKELKKLSREHTESLIKVSREIANLANAAEKTEEAIKKSLKASQELTYYLVSILNTKEEEN